MNMSSLTSSSYNQDRFFTPLLASTPVLASIPSSTSISMLTLPVGVLLAYGTTAGEERVGSHYLQPQQNVDFQQTDALVDTVVVVKD
jgi:hypothetical protein